MALNTLSSARNGGATLGIARPERLLRVWVRRRPTYTASIPAARNPPPPRSARVIVAPSTWNPESSGTPPEPTVVWVSVSAALDGASAGASVGLSSAAGGSDATGGTTSVSGSSTGGCTCSTVGGSLTRSSGTTKRCPGKIQAG